MRKKRIVYYILFILTLILISYYGGPVSYGIFYFVLLIPIVSYIYLFLVAALFRVYQEIKGRDIICNSPKDYYFVLKNDSYITFSSISIKLYSSFSYIEELPDETDFCLAKGEQYRYDTRIICKYRGEYEIGIKEIVFTDFLKLFQLKYKIMGPVKAIVSPKIVSLDSVKGLEDVVTIASKESYYQKDELDTVVRDYVSGDPIRNINWKLTAKDGSLKTRLMTGEEKQGVILVMDTKRYSEDNMKYIPLEDRMISTMLAIALYFAKKGIPLKVVYEQNGVCQYDSKNLDDFQTLYKMTDTLIFSNDFDLKNVLEDRILFNHAVVISIVHDMTDECFMAFKEISDKGTYVVSYFVADEGVSQSHESTLRNRIINVPIDGDITEVLS